MKGSLGLGPPAPLAANKQAWRAGLARAPAEGAQLPPTGAWVGALSAGGSAPSRVMNPAERLCGAARVRLVSCSRRGGRRRGRAAPPTRRIPLRGLGRAGSSAWQSSRGNSMFRNSSRVAGGGGRRTREAHGGCPHPPVTSPEGGQRRPPSLMGSHGGWGWQVHGPILLCMFLFPLHSRKFLNRFIY